MEVYVVRQFFDDCNDAYYIGVYSDFFKAILAAEKDSKDSWGDPPYTFNVHLPRDEGETELWCEIFYEGSPRGICYTITKMELDK